MLPFSLGLATESACFSGILPNRSVLKLSGRGLQPLMQVGPLPLAMTPLQYQVQTVHLLQKLISNDMEELEQTGSPLVYACALNAQVQLQATAGEGEQGVSWPMPVVST